MFVTFEGGEGSGKSTLIDKLEDELRSRGLEVVVTRAPGGTLLGQEVRELILNPGEGIRVGKKS